MNQKFTATCMTSCRINPHSPRCHCDDHHVRGIDAGKATGLAERGGTETVQRVNGFAAQTFNCCVIEIKRERLVFLFGEAFHFAAVAVDVAGVASIGEEALQNTHAAESFKVNLHVLWRGGGNIVT